MWLYFPVSTFEGFFFLLLFNHLTLILISSIHKVRLLAILPWFAILFTCIAAVTLFLASRRRAIPSRGLASTSAASGVGQREDREGVEEVREKEKGGEDEKGRV